MKEIPRKEKDVVKLKLGSKRKKKKSIPKSISISNPILS